MEGLGFLTLAIAEAAAIDAERAGVALTSGAFFVSCAAGLLWCAWGLARGYAWSRGPLVVGQLLLLAVAWSYRQPYPAAAVVVAALAVGTLALVGHPATTRSRSD